MLLKIKELWSLTRAAKQQGVSIQRRLWLYWVSMALAVFALLLLVLSFAGVFSDPAKKLSDALELQQCNTVSALSDQLSGLTAQCVSLSETASKELSNVLIEHGASFDDLNDNQALIVEVEEALYAPVYSTLRAGDCSGVFVALNATTNTGLANAEHSRMGLYLRYSDLNSTGSANQHLIYFRGVSEIARSRQVQMHNRWNLEFDTTCLPGYDAFLTAPTGRLADRGAWSGRVHLKDTWEDVLLLYIPVLDSNGAVIGLCGAELSGLYFRLSYPSISSNYGGMITLLAPLDGDRLLLDEAMLGDSDSLRPESDEAMDFKKGAYYNTYTIGGQRFLGLHQALSCKTADGYPLAAVTLLPERGYDQMASSSRATWIVGSLFFLLCMLALALFLSRRFVRPITRSIQAIQDSPTDNQPSGISEIDALLAFIRTEAAAQELEPGALPPNIEELLRGFQEKADSLTPTERTVLQYFIEGLTIEEVAERSFISIATAKRHNTNLNRKLGISSRSELMVYIDLFRRCNRLSEITHRR